MSKHETDVSTQLTYLGKHASRITAVERELFRKDSAPDRGNVAVPIGVLAGSVAGFIEAGWWRRA